MPSRSPYVIPTSEERAQSRSAAKIKFSIDIETENNKDENDTNSKESKQDKLAHLWPQESLCNRIRVKFDLGINNIADKDDIDVTISPSRQNDSKHTPSINKLKKQLTVPTKSGGSDGDSESSDFECDRKVWYLDPKAKDSLDKSLSTPNPKRKRKKRMKRKAFSEDISDLEVNKSRINKHRLTAGDSKLKRQSRLQLPDTLQDGKISDVTDYSDLETDTKETFLRTTHKRRVSMVIKESEEEFLDGLKGSERNISASVEKIDVTSRLKNDESNEEFSVKLKGSEKELSSSADKINRLDEEIAVTRL